MTFFVVKTLHIVFVVSWYAGLFHLPRLFVYHAMATDPAVTATLKTMERKALLRHHDAAMVLSVVLGGCCGWASRSAKGKAGCWKAALVGVLIVLHFYLGRCMAAFREDRNTRSHVFYRWLNEIPALPILIAAIVPRRCEAELVSNAPERFFAICPHGLSGVLADELQGEVHRRHCGGVEPNWRGV